MNGRIVIIDGNSLINRAYYAMRNPMITSKGVYTQGVYGFLNMLNKIKYDYSPEYIAVAWDKKAPTFRHKEYKEYKAGRKKMPPELAMQIPLTKEIMDAMNIANLEIEGFEADDIIGTVARSAEEQGLKPLIITGDKDALQLATQNAQILLTRKGISEFDLYDEDKMKEVYGMTPEQFIDLKGLMGDKSDNIPGVPGVGEKTGKALIAQFGSIQNMLVNIDEIKNEKLQKKIEENAQLALMSKKLATINTRVPIDFDVSSFKSVEADEKRLIDIYAELEFNSFLKKMHVSKNDKDEVQLEPQTTVLLNSIGDLAKLESIDNGDDIVIKIISDFSHLNKPTVSACSILHKGVFYFASKSDELIKNLFDLIETKSLKISGHDLVETCYVVKCLGLDDLNLSFDTALAQYIIDPSRSNYTLKTLMLEHFHMEIESDDDKQMQISMFTDEDERNLKECKRACMAVYHLKKHLETMINDSDFKSLYYDIELPLIAVLADMESVGFKVDQNRLNSFSEELSIQINEITKLIYDDAGMEFNINSPAQLSEVLFKKLELPPVKKTKTGYSTNAEVLNKLSKKHSIINKVLEYRNLSKLKSTYVDGLYPLIGSDNSIRTHFNQTVTATGRISCTAPNLQNIPIRSENGRLIRKAFIPRTQDNVLIGADYSQIELRVLAHLSGDNNLINAFKNNADIHRMTASRVFDVEYDKVTDLERSRAKAVNFGVIYGMSSFGLSEELHISLKNAESYINDYFNKHPKVKAYMDEQVELCRKNGYTQTITGRRRYIHEINASNKMMRNAGERLAMNTPIQGSAADIIKKAMIEVYNKLRSGRFKSKLILQVHDELIVDVPKNELEEVSKLLVKSMESAMSLKVELESELHQGSSWYELK